MTADYYPLQVLLLACSGWVNREQQRTIEYLVEENRVLKEQFKGRKLRITDDQRRRLAAKGKQLGRRLLNRVATIVTPDTIMRWHRRLIAFKWTHETPTPGRRGIMRAIRELIVRMALENSTWGYTRIQGELKDVGHHVGRGTIARTLKDNGIKPAPEIALLRGRLSSGRIGARLPRRTSSRLKFGLRGAWSPTTRSS